MMNIFCGYCGQLLETNFLQEFLARHIGVKVRCKGKHSAIIRIKGVE